MLKLLVFILLYSTTLIGKTFVIGRDPYWSSIDLSNREPQVNAFINELSQEISNMGKGELEIQDGNLEYLERNMDAGCYQGILTIVNPSIANKDRYDFSSPIIFLGPVIIVRSNSKDSSLNDLEGKTIGISSFDKTVYVAQKIPCVIIKNYENLHFALHDLLAGKLDAVLMPTLQAKATISQRYPLTLKIASPPLSNEAIRLVVLKGKQRDLLTIFNKGLKEMKKSGLFNWLQREYSVY